MNDFTIRDLENLSGIKAHTIRIWEQRYSFLRPKRTETNIRYYSNDELKVILNVALLNKYGYKISQIDRMSETEVKQKVVSLNSAEAVQDRVINELIQAMIDMDMEQFEHAMDGYIFTRGVDKAITQIIFPFLERVGILWMTGHIVPAQEHLVSNVIRQKILVGIDGTVSHTRSDKTLLLFLPEGEHHEIGILYIYYLLKVRGIKTLYLGADVPFKDLEFVAKLKKPDYIYTHLTTRPRYFNLEKFLDRFTSQLPGTPLIISGNKVISNVKKEYNSVHFKNSLQGMLEFISSL